MISGCPKNTGETMLSENEVLEFAAKSFEETSRSVKDYDVEIKEHHSDAGKWIVWYDKKGPFRIPGEKHAVVVDKITGESLFLPGE